MLYDADNMPSLDVPTSELIARRAAIACDRSSQHRDAALERERRHIAVEWLAEISRHVATIRSIDRVLRERGEDIHCRPSLEDLYQQWRADYVEATGDDVSLRRELSR